MNNLDLVTEQNTVKDEELWHREGVGENEEEEETEEEEKEKEEKERRRRKQEEGKEENLVSPMSWRISPWSSPACKRALPWALLSEI